MIITIDGPAISGKSTVAQALAKELGGYYIYSGLLFRAAAYLLHVYAQYDEDSIHKISTLIPNKNIAEAVYSIQLGIYKDLDIKLTPQEAVNFTEVKTDYGSAYQIGSFLSYKTATEFKNQLIRIGLNDVFIVAYNKKKERIPINEALVLSNEEALLKD